MKKIMKIAIVAIVATVAGYGIYDNQMKTRMSELTLENVEALAAWESTDECSGCIKNSLSFCKFFGWGGCFGDSMYHYA